MSVVVIGAALVVTAPPLALAWLLAIPPIVGVSRWYFRRAPAAYRSEMGSYAAVNAVVAESVDAGRTVETYRLGGARVELTDRRVGQWLDWERYTLYLRSVFFPSVGSAYVVPLAVVVGVGGWLVADGRISIAAFTAAVLYTQMLIEPVDLVLMSFDELQVGQASLARLLGVAEVTAPPSDPDERPADEHLEAHDVHFGYRHDQDVLRGINLGVVPGERLAVVGPSGAGKSTMARLLAGIHPARSGEVLLGGADVSVMLPERIRRHVVLVTQEHHVFVGPLRDNLLLANSGAADADLWHAFEVVGADTLGPPPARRARHRSRLGVGERVAGAGPTDRAGPLGGGRPAHVDPRRGDLAAGPARRPNAGALADPGAGRAYGRVDRAPTAHGARRRPRRRGGGRPDQRAGQPRRSRRGAGVIRGPVGVVAGRVEHARTSRSSSRSTPAPTPTVHRRHDPLGPWCSASLADRAAGSSSKPGRRSRPRSLPAGSSRC